MGGNAYNKRIQRIGRFLRFSGHPELTIQECIKCQNPALERLIGNWGRAIEVKTQYLLILELSVFCPR